MKVNVKRKLLEPQRQRHLKLVEPRRRRHLKLLEPRRRRHRKVIKRFMIVQYAGECGICHVSSFKSDDSHEAQHMSEDFRQNLQPSCSQGNIDLLVML